MKNITKNKSSGSLKFPKSVYVVIISLKSGDLRLGLPSYNTAYKLDKSRIFSNLILLNGKWSTIMVKFWIPSI